MTPTDKLCVVTGAAGGIGEAIARAYAAAGARGVVVSDLPAARERLEAVARDIGGLAVVADVSREADVNQAGDVRPLYAAILRGDAATATHLVSSGADADIAGCVRATLPGTMEGESAKALAGKKGEPFVSIVAKARPATSLIKPKKDGELKRITLCSH